jgi:uncharacterized membrane protein
LAATGGTARLQAIDVYRGVALAVMAAYHLAWDLNYYGFISTGIGVDAAWLGTQRSILGAFLLLSGASLMLAHGRGIRWRSFWRREAILVAAALAVSGVTYLIFGPALAWFGVLHAIALCSILALPFLSAPIGIGLLVAAASIVAGILAQSDVFDPQWLDWIGFARQIPDTADLVPMFPWFGVFLIGVLGMRVLRDRPLATWRSNALAVRGLGLLGRWSLLFYLLHQFVLFGIVMLAANLLNPGEETKIASFTKSCTAQCLPGHSTAFCTGYCGCALDVTVRDNLWSAIDASPRSVAQQRSVEAMTTLCSAMSE